MDLLHESRPDLAYQTLAEEILVVLRGDLSQRELSEKIGYTFNQVGKWETGATKIKWDEFLNFADALNLPIESQFRKMFFPLFEGEFTPVTALRHIIEIIKPDRSLWSTATVRNWLRGTSSPLFADVLRIFGTRPAMLYTWLSTFVDCAKIPALHDAYQAFLVRGELLMQDPTCAYVNAALNLEAYKQLKYHDEELLAEHSGCSVEHLRTTLRSMLLQEIVRFENGKYLPCPFDFSLSTTRTINGRSLMKHSLELLASRYDALRTTTQVSNYFVNPSMGSIRVAAMSEAAARKVAELITSVNNQFAQIVAEDTGPKEAVQTILINSVPANINSPIRSKNSRLKEIV